MPKDLSLWVATKISGSNGVIDVTYYDTKVVSFDADTITLRTGGHKTMTTLKRMNQAARQFHLGFRVFVRSGRWCVMPSNGEQLTFSDDTLSFTRSGAIA